MSQFKKVPSLGRIVILAGCDSNSAKEHPAIITRVWSDNCVNLAVFLDNGGVTNKTSVTLFNNEEEAATFLATNAHNTCETCCCYWPSTTPTQTFSGEDTPKEVIHTHGVKHK